MSSPSSPSSLTGLFLPTGLCFLTGLFPPSSPSGLFLPDRLVLPDGLFPPSSRRVCSPRSPRSLGENGRRPPRRSAPPRMRHLRQLKQRSRRLTFRRRALCRLRSFPRRRQNWHPPEIISWTLDEDNG